MCDKGAEQAAHCAALGKGSWNTAPSESRLGPAGEKEVRRLKAGFRRDSRGSCGAGEGLATRPWREEKEKWGLETGVSREDLWELCPRLHSLPGPGKPRVDTRTGTRALELGVGCSWGWVPGESVQEQEHAGPALCGYNIFNSAASLSPSPDMWPCHSQSSHAPSKSVLFMTHTWSPITEECAPVPA